MSEKNNRQMFATITAQLECQRALLMAIFASLPTTQRTRCTVATMGKMHQELQAMDRDDEVSIVAMTSALERLMADLEYLHDAAMPPKTH
jgi:hypothetical protein